MSTVTQSGTLVRGIPLLPTTDLDATARFYADTLGFAVVATYGDYLVVSRDAVQLHFWLTHDVNLAEESACRIDVTGIDALYEEMDAAGVVQPNGQLREQSYGMRDFHVVDNCGNDLRFQERVA